MSDRCFLRRFRRIAPWQAIAIVLAGVGGVAGCAGPDEDPGTEGPVRQAVASDSAGVRIVENPLQAPDTTGWWIDTVPALLLGNDETRGEEYLFGHATDARRLSDGRLLVVDRQSNDVRVFDPSGGFLGRIGRAGEGPAEYRRALALFVLPGDTFLVRSSYQGDAAPTFTPSGEYVRSWRPPGEPLQIQGTTYGIPIPWAAFSDGTVLVQASPPRPAIGDDAEPRTPIPSERSSRILRMGHNREILTDFGERVVERSTMYPDRIGRMWIDGMSVIEPRYHPQPTWAVHGNVLYWSEGESFEIRAYDREGRLLRVILKRHDPVSIPRAWSDSLWRAARAGLEAGVREEGFGWLTDVDPPPLLEHAPPVSRLLVDDLGNLWVRSDPLGHAEPPTWFVFDTTGVLTHSLRSELDPVQIGDDFVVAIVRGEFDVPQVAIYLLRKRGMPADGCRSSARDRILAPSTASFLQQAGGAR